MIKPIGSKFSLADERLNEYNSFVDDLFNNEVVQQMKNYIQHGNTTTFEHCVNVSYYNYLLCKKFSLDARAGARGGMLHDLFLYDWHTYKGENGFHGSYHPKLALNNALKYFTISDLESEIIEKHMFPLTLSLPKHKETYVIILVDKYCGLLETVLFRAQIIHHGFTKVKESVKKVFAN